MLLNHYLWFRHFSTPTPQTYPYDPSQLPSFSEISSFFGICVWLTPFALFVSLSASDLTLPTMGSEAPGVGGFGDGRSGNGKRKGQSMIKSVIDGFRGWVREVGSMFGWWKVGQDGF